MKILSPAKINLGLEIGEKNIKGYHKVDMIMQSVSIFDEIDLSFSSNKGINLSIDKNINCTLEKNIAYRAAKEFFKYTKLKDRGIKISIKKNIPMCAGLAGGSADGAGVIVGLNEIFKTKMKKSELCEIGAKIGSDVPFCILGGAALAQGVGTDLTPTRIIPDCTILVVKPNISVSTAEAYSRFDDLKIIKKHSMNSLSLALASGNLDEICGNLYNCFEEVINNDEIFRIKQDLKDFGALGSLMTGSGSAVYGVFDDKNKAEICLKGLSNNYDFVNLAKPLSHGAYII